LIGGAFFSRMGGESTCRHIKSAYTYSMAPAEPQVIYDASEVRYDTSPLGPGPNWVTKADPMAGLGSFIRAIAHALIRNGHSESQAIALAVAAVKRWAHGGKAWGPNSHVTPATQAKAQEALAHWEAIKAKADSRSISIEPSVRAVGPAIITGAYAVGHPFHGNQHTGSLGVGRQAPGKNAKVKAHQTAHNTAHVTASDTAKGIAPGSAQAQAAYAAVAGIPSGTATAASSGSSGGSSGSNTATLEQALTTAQHNLNAVTAQQAQNVQFAKLKAQDAPAGSNQAVQNQATEASIAAVELAAQNAIQAAQDQLAAAKAALRSDQDELWTRDFVGEGNPAGVNNASGAAALLPAGPTLAQDNAITEKLTSSPHRFKGHDLDSCSTCSKPITDPIHATKNAEEVSFEHPKVPTTRLNPAIRGNAGVVHQPVDGPPPSDQIAADIPTEPHEFAGPKANPCQLCSRMYPHPVHHTEKKTPAHQKTGHTPPPISLQRDDEPANEQFSDMTKPHRFVGADIAHCQSCGQAVQAPIHHGGEKEPGQPIPPVPREASLLRHSGSDHLNVPTGHLKGYETVVGKRNAKNIATVRGPLQAALEAHFDEQRTSTINRLLGKRGGKMLRRAAELAKTTSVDLGASYESSTPAPLPGPDDLNKTTLEPNTTSPIDQPDGLNGPVNEPNTSLDTGADDEIRVGINPQDVFDQGFWAKKLEGVLYPHLGTASVLAQNEVRSQIHLGEQVDDGAAEGAMQSVIALRAAAASLAITNTTSRHLAGALQEGVVAGEDRGAIAKRLSDVFERAKTARAGQIAATTAGGGYNESSHAYASALPAEHLGQKVWLSDHQGESNSRPEHQEADGQTRSISEPFQVGGAALLFPGDTGAPIKEWIACGCSAAYLPPEA
jgi:hypothetical protein